MLASHPLFIRFATVKIRNIFAYCRMCDCDEETQRWACMANIGIVLIRSRYLPILSATFHNLRFQPPHVIEPPCDQPPFLDSDVARATVLLSWDDFNFFRLEFRMPDYRDESHAEPPSFVCLQFMEMGGDHLDSLMALDAQQSMELENCQRNHEDGEQDVVVVSSIGKSNVTVAGDDGKYAAALGECLRQSKLVLGTTGKCAYFVNMNSLVNVAKSDADSSLVDVVLSVDAFTKLLDRFEYLARALPKDRQVSR